jgi:plastocyanin
MKKIICMKKNLYPLPLILFMSVAFAFAGCSKSSTNNTTGGTTTGNNPGAGTLSTNVAISGFAFSPATLTVKTGTVIKVTNNDAAAHTLTADDNSFDTGNIPGGGSANLTVTKVGAFPFHCAYHSAMTGTLTVTN